MIVKFKKLQGIAKIPAYAHNDDAGMDLFSCDDIMIKVGKRELIQTGISIELPVGYEAQIRSRSGLALKRGIIVLNAPGTSEFR